ncbi:MAG: GatB/YqeY domain-containing protein [Burkholderiaceae bacterium]|jgi:uncharacterized protein YqeY
MSLKDRLLEDIKQAMKAKDSLRLTTLRLVTAAIKQREVDERITLDDVQVLAILDKMVKQRRDSVSQFQAGGRQDLVDQEQSEIDILLLYLPQPLSEAEIMALIEAELASLTAQGTPPGPGLMGKAMAALKPHIAGRADGAVVSRLLKQKLSQ